MSLKRYMLICFVVYLPVCAALGAWADIFKPALSLTEWLIFTVAYAACGALGAGMVGLATPKTDRLDFLSYKWANYLLVFPSTIAGLIFIGMHMGMILARMASADLS